MLYKNTLDSIGKCYACVVICIMMMLTMANLDQINVGISISTLFYFFIFFNMVNYTYIIEIFAQFD